MSNLDIPTGKRSLKYRFFEVLPAVTSYSMVGILITLSFVSPFWAAAYLLLLIITVFVKAIGIGYHTIMGHKYLTRAQKINWHERLMQLENPGHHVVDRSNDKQEFGYGVHIDNLKLISKKPSDYPKPSNIYNAVIVAAYNESYDVIKPTIQSLADTTYDLKNMIIVFAYEERGGEDIAKTAARLKDEYGGVFKEFQLVKHPKDLPGEVVGKGANITYAGEKLAEWCHGESIDYSSVIVTTLDCDNKPYRSYFDYVTYEYIVHSKRKHLSFQPVSLFLNNIWDAPAPMRVIATGNSFWNIISSMRPHTLRNFASHSQPLEALVEMNFWSKLTIVEDGHQYWRSFFHFKGDYDVVPIFVPIYQDAVLAETYRKTLKAQFIQLRRWAYGASDVPYVATRIFSSNRQVPFFSGFSKFIRLLDGHVTLAGMAPIIAFGGWLPLLLNSQAARDISAHQLPNIVSSIQQVAMIGIFITVFLSLRMLPPRPKRYNKTRTVAMVLQWVLMPLTSIVYSSLASFNAQTHLMLGKYLDKFDVTEKTAKKDL